MSLPFNLGFELACFVACEPGVSCRCANRMSFVDLLQLEGKDPSSINETEKPMENQVKMPYVGAVVIYHVADSEKVQNNHADEMPAIVTRIWGTTPSACINLKCLPDGTGTFWRTSINHQRLGKADGPVMAQGASWRWPDEDLARGDAPMDASE